MSLNKTDQQLGSVPLSESGVAWRSVVVHHSGDRFFDDLERAISAARKMINIEMYIFADDRLGQRFINLLGEAAKRGVDVRVIIDGIGSSTWVSALRAKARELGIHLRVFHELPWSRWWSRRGATKRRFSLSRALQRINNRNHRKVCIIDRAWAFVGSMNIIECHSARLVGSSAWRDTGVVVEGDEVGVLVASFHELWERRARFLSRARKLAKRSVSGKLVRLNTRRALRRENYLDLLVRILGAKQRIWIENAYFVPDGALVRALKVAAESGVDVKIVVPAISDVFFIPWVTAAFNLGLLRAGVKVFEYNKGMMHAKTMLIDDWGLVGSSNLNHRSLFHDLEADLVLANTEACQSLERQFLIDCENSAQVTLENWRSRPALERFIGKALLLFKGVL